VRVGKTDTAAQLLSITLSSARGGNCRHDRSSCRPRWWLEQCECERLGTDRARRRNDPGIEPGAVREYYITVTGTANYGGGSNPPLGLAPIPNRSSPSMIRRPGRLCAERRPRSRPAMHHQRRAESTLLDRHFRARGVTTSPRELTPAPSPLPCSGQYDHSGHAHGVEL